MGPEEQWPTRVSDTGIISGNAVAVDDETIRQPTVQSPLPPERPENAIGRRVLIGLALLAIAAVGALAVWLLTHRGNSGQTNAGATTSPVATKTATVPELVGLDEEAAMIQLGKAGLSPKIQQRTTGPTDGLVSSQRPPRSSKVRPGAAVTILLDRPRANPVPAKPTSTSTSQTTTTPAKPATVPDLSGKDEQGAVQALYDATLIPSIVFVPAHDLLGTVEGQAKPAGTQIPANSPVQITISKGPGQNPDETVPDVIGKTLTDALSTINGQQLRLIYLKQPVTTPQQAGTILKQTPLPGDHAPRNGQVLVYLAAFRPNG
jgi:beta-lactam-binding protein with PASTA domain